MIVAKRRATRWLGTVPFGTRIVAHCSDTTVLCTSLTEERRKITSLQQPYEEEENKIMMKFLFDDSSVMEVKKEQLYNLWRSRKKKLLAASN